MKDILFFKTNTGDTAELSNIAGMLTKKLIEDYSFEINHNVALKVHFGEKGNETFLNPGIYDEVINILKINNSNPVYIETNVLYRGERTNRTSHLRLAKEHNFTQIPIVIADGEIGEDYYEQEINKKHFKKCKIGKAFQQYNTYIVGSHFKGHVLSGFGGALKQLAMGFAARGGKLEQHSKMLPMVKQDKCIVCGLCINKCQVNAISMDKYACIDKEKCFGCAGCIAVCPVGAIVHDWNADFFIEKMMEYAYAAHLNKRMIYLNFLVNITKDCDCLGMKMTPLTDNIGVLAGFDPVAIDTASLEILQKVSKSKLFDNGRQGLVYAEKIGLGTQNYNLIEVQS